VGGRQGDELAAIVYLRLSLYLAPKNGLATVTLADIFERLKQYEQAIEVYDSVGEDSPLRVNADIQTALLLETLGKTEEAQKRLQDIVNEKPKNEEALTALGNLQRSRKQFAEAAATYTKALALSSKAEKSIWSLYYYRGIAYERQKQWPKAEADFKKALELFPDQPLVLNYLGYSWVDQGINLDEAFKMLRRAVELRPTDGYVVDSLGWAHFKLGQYDQAVKELERAIELKASDPVINDHLGDAYWRVGRKLEGHFQWNHARDLKPEPEDLDRILKKIENGLAEEEKPAAAEAEPKKQTESKNGG
jgi:Flp pilus assembly protein TadD